MDFYKIKKIIKNNGRIEITPDFIIKPSSDLMVKSNSFFAIWDEKNKVWSKDEYDVARLVDEDLYSFYNSLPKETKECAYVTEMSSFTSGAWKNYKYYLSKAPDSYKMLDNKLIFSNSEVRKEDYATKKLSYPFVRGKHDSYNKLMDTLYSQEERQKIEWAIGSIIEGDSRNIQKFIVLYGEGGTGKSTVLNIIQDLFKGYYTNFEAKSIVSNNNTFSTEVFKDNPLVAIQHDGDLSHIEDNSKFNSIVSHEQMTMNEKYKASYSSRVNAFLFMGTNKPVKITDSKSGIIRRLIDVHPTGNKLPPDEYTKLVSEIKFELGPIAYWCNRVYKKLGPNFYNAYKPLDMMYKTDFFFNFMEDNQLIFMNTSDEEPMTLARGYAMYKEYCEDNGVSYVMPKYKFREEFKNYFEEYHDRVQYEGKRIRSVFKNFKLGKLEREETYILKKEQMIEEMKETYELEKESKKIDLDLCKSKLNLVKQKSLFDESYSDCLAQLARVPQGTPRYKWSNVTTTLKDIDTSYLHYVKVPENHIVIDFDVRDAKNLKSLDKSIVEASKWPETYAEVSRSGKGIHLHYIYDGDPKKLSNIYDDQIEIKVFTGNSSLRRCLTLCNDKPIAHLNSGLPLKGEKVISFDGLKNEKALRTVIERNLRKEIHPGTKPSVDFISKVLDDAYLSEMHYDVTDMRPKILAFAASSTNHSSYCIKLVNNMKFHSEDVSDNDESAYASDELIFFDVEVFSNLFVVVWKAEGKDAVKMINPTPSEIEELMRFKLVGFNCRRYDNHILYARLLGYTNEQLYELSQRLINGSKNATFRQAYNVSYTDVYDFSSKKQSLKKFEIELGIHHQELGLRWDEPAPEDMWELVADYCINDVVATEATFNARKQDFIARQVLAKLSGLSVNDSTQSHTAKIIFGNDPKPQSKFVYTDLSEMFPGYTFDHGKSEYCGEETGEGGYVYAEPGMYGNVALLDIASMHPNSLIQLNLFGPYTKNFKDLLDARLAIKHKDYAKAKTMLNGVLAPFLESEDDSEALAYALKIVINIVYGLTSAKFENKFRDPRNIDNIVAKRGALFMINLKHEVQKKGFTVAHIKTDSIKIPDATPEIIEFVMEYGKQYGYTFEHEATYDRMCLVNNAVYIAKYKGGKHDMEWTATGAQFQHPYIFKTLFSKEPVIFSDLCETKTVQTALYLDINEGLPDVTSYELELANRRYNHDYSTERPKEKKLNPIYTSYSDEALEEIIATGHNYKFIGKAGAFVPVVSGIGGGWLVREAKTGNKFSSANGCKGYRWLEAEVVENLHQEDKVDMRYFHELADEAIASIKEFGDYEWFVSDEPYVELPW